MEEKKYLHRKERLGFGFAGFGQNMIYCIMSMYLMYYYTDIFFGGNSPAYVMIGITVLQVAARIWDSINDPIMGAIVDKVKFKNSKEKFRPWLRFAPMLIMITTSLLFLNVFGAKNYVIKLVYMFATYILWDLSYTIGDIPYWSLSSVVTPNEKERADLISKTRVYCTVGAVIPMAYMMFMDMIFNENQQQLKYTIAAIITSVIGGGLFYLSYVSTKERIILPREEQSFKDMFKMLLSNKPLLIVLIAGILGATRMMAQSAAIYAAKDIFLADGFVLFGKEVIKAGDFTKENIATTILAAGFGIGLFIGVGMGPWLAKKFNYKKTYIYSSLFGFAVQLILYFIDYSQSELIILFLLLAGIPMGIYQMLTYNMVADSADYAEYKTGERNEGLCFSFQTFMTKLVGSIGALIVGLVFIISKRNTYGNVKPPNVKNATYALISIIPAIGCIISIIPMLFYDFVDDKKQKILDELKIKRLEKNSIVDAATEASDTTVTE